MTTRTGARRFGACCLIVCVHMVVMLPSHADWNAIPDIRLEAEANDNPALEADIGTAPRIDSASRLLADVIVNIRREEPRGDLVFEPRVRGDAYADDNTEGLESTDVFLRSSGRYRGQRAQLGYNADLGRERNLGIEFLETLPTEPVADDPSSVATSEVGVNERRTRLGLTPYVDFVLNSRSLLRLDSRVVDVDYQSNLPGRSDFEERMFGTEYQRALGGQRGRLGIRLFVTDYEAELNDNNTDTQGFELSYRREISELWSWSLSLGSQRSEFEFDTLQGRVIGDESTPLFGFGLDKRGERSGMRAELAREMSPDSMGFVAPRDELRVAWQRFLAAQVSGRLVVRAIDAEGTPTVANSDRRYGRLEIGVEWQFQPTWWFTAGYAYDATSSSATISAPFGSDDSADANSLTLGFRYRGRSPQTTPLR
jgi:hypothetical protein